jgi:hypothetical protein
MTELAEFCEFVVTDLFASPPMSRPGIDTPPLSPNPSDSCGRKEPPTLVEFIVRLRFAGPPPKLTAFLGLCTLPHPFACHHRTSSTLPFKAVKDPLPFCKRDGFIAASPLLVGPHAVFQDFHGRHLL